MLAVYFDFQVPWKDNQVLRSKVKVLEDSSFIQAEFITLVETTKRSIDSLGNSDVNNLLFNIQLLDDKVKELRDAKFKDNGVFSETNKTMFSLFADYEELKKTNASITERGGSYKRIGAGAKSMQKQ